MIKLTSASAAAGLGSVVMPRTVSANEMSEVPTNLLSVDQLVSDFAQPPAQARPWCYWYWVSNYISREGITRDVEAMARVGIGEAMIANIAGRDTPLGDVKLFSEEWWSLIEHAIREAKRVGINIGIFNGPGWSQSGGPWIPTERSMRYVVSSETRIVGPTRFEGKLSSPKESFQGIGTLAFPMPKNDTDTIAAHFPQIQCNPEIANPEHLMDGDLRTHCLFPSGLADKKPFVIDVVVAEPFTARSLGLYPIEDNVYFRCKLEYEDALGVFKAVRTFVMDRRGLDRPQFRLIVGPMVTGPKVITFPPITSRHFRLVIENLIGTGGLTEIKLSAAARLDSFVEKELGKMYPAPLPEWDSYLWPPSTEPDSPDLAIAPRQIVDLSDRVSPDGMLSWDVPAGQWIILRSGMIPVGITNHPTTNEGLGLECDKMSREAVDLHFNSFVGKLLRRMPPPDRTALRHVVVDSFEVGSENWTDNFHERFQKVLGYDPRSWLPVLTGRIVGTSNQSDRFLWDMRRLIADEIAKEYVGGLREISNQHGLRLLVEPYGSWGFPAEFLQYGGQADDVAGEFWVNDDSLAAKENVEVRAASSSAHIYGKRVVIAEAFTSARSFRDSPAQLKTLGDWAYTQGINHFMLHVYIHQPWEEKVPGVNAWFGTEFNRHNTWFEQSKSWIDYLRRCQFLLQQGRSTADVAYFIGEDTPKMSGPRHPDLPDCYDYDFINAEVLLSRVRVEDGLLTIPNGPAYSLLVLPPLETMRPAVLRKIRDLVAEGISILGPPPKRSPSLQNYPACDEEVRELVSELWGTAENHEDSFAERSFGKGRVFSGGDMAPVLRRLKTAPAISCPKEILWTLRKTDNAEIYFLSNQTDEFQFVEATFRNSGRIPEFWHPDSGAVEQTAWFSYEGDRTRVPLTLDPQGSVFVVFRHSVQEPSIIQVAVNDQPIRESVGLCPIRIIRSENGFASAKISRPGRYTLERADGKRASIDVPHIPAPITLDRPWKVLFCSRTGVALKQIDILHLHSWADSSDNLIRLFSGTASYQTHVNVPDEMLIPGRRVTLDLGRVEVIAQVRVNGKDLGVLWKQPFSVDITDVVSPGSNKIEILVTNTWWNRLAGDEALRPDERTTFTVWQPATPRAFLLPSGLLGPVSIRNEVIREIKI